MTTAPDPKALPLEARALSKTYRVGFWMNRSVKALQGMDLTVGAGQIYGLLGPNGAGKSTTIKILMNLVRASSGTASLFGRSIEDASVRRWVGFLPENPAPYEYLTGREFVTLAGRLSGLSGQELDKRVTEVIGAVEMSAAAKLQIRRYSKGMVQRVALAQAMVANPRLLILDEPTSGLDPLGRKHMRELIEAQRAAGTTVLFCSHIIPDVEALCDRVAILVAGRRVREGTVQELLSGDQARVQLELVGITAERAQSLGVPILAVRPQSSTIQIETDQAHSSSFLGAALAAGAQVQSVQPLRQSLEQLFMRSVEEAGGVSKVGGVIDA